MVKPLFSPVDHPPRKFIAECPQPALLGSLARGNSTIYVVMVSPAANAVVPIPANIPRHMSMAMNRDRGFLNAFIVLPPKNGRKKAHRFRCAVACVGYCLKKRGPPGFPRSLMSACGKEAGAFYKHPGSPNIFFFRLFRLFGRGEVWRGGTGTSRRFSANGRTSPL